MAQSDERHSRKRAAEGDPDGAQPLTKRFGRLHLGMLPRGMRVAIAIVIAIAIAMRCDAMRLRCDCCDSN